LCCRSHCAASRQTLSAAMSPRPKAVAFIISHESTRQRHFIDCEKPFAKQHVGVRVQGSGFRVQGSGFRVQGSGFRVQDSGFRIHGSGFGIQGSGLRAQGSGLRAQGSGLRAQGSGLGAQGSGLRAQGSGLRAQGLEIRIWLGVEDSGRSNFGDTHNKNELSSIKTII
jgi:hypothetical protein